MPDDDEEHRPALHIPSLTGVWRTVYDDREALHTAADRAVLVAFAACVKADADVDDAAAAAVQALVDRTFETDVPGEPGTSKGRRRRLDLLAATLAAIWYRMAHGTSWETLRTVLAEQLAAAWRAGWAASRAVNTPDATGDIPDPPAMTGTADTTLLTASRWTIKGAAKAAAKVLIAAATSGRAVRKIARALRAFLKDPLGLSLAVDQAVSAAYAAGMAAHLRQIGALSVQWLTAGDTRVCAACEAQQAGSPYPLDQAPMPPQHPLCRCVIVPA